MQLSKTLSYIHKQLELDCDRICCKAQTTACCKLYCRWRKEILCVSAAHKPWPLPVNGYKKRKRNLSKLGSPGAKYGWLQQVHCQGVEYLWVVFVIMCPQTICLFVYYLFITSHQETFQYFKYKRIYGFYLA